jgi:hypothetical protein
MFSVLLLIAEGVKVKVYFQAQAHRVKGRTFLQVEDMKMDFSVKDIKMGIENLHNGNTVLRKYFRAWGHCGRTSLDSVGARTQSPPHF